MLIGLTGYARSGKDTVANILIKNFGFTRVAFADPIRDFCYEFNPIVSYVANEPIHLRKLVDRDGWEEAKKMESVRHMLQFVGVGARKIFGEDFWIEQAKKSIGDKNTVITDVRFTNEADMIKSLGGQIWRIRRTGIDAANDHVSETQMDGYKVDQIFLNGGSIEELEQLVKTRMRGYNSPSDN